MKNLIYIFLLITVSAQAQGVQISIANSDYQTGETFTAPAYVSGFTAITAMQFALLYDTAALILTSITPGNVQGYGLGDFSVAAPGYSLKAGEIRSVFNDPYGVTAADNTIAFSLNFTAKQAGSLVNDLAVYPQGLYPMAYTFPLIGIPLEIAFFDITTGTDTPQSESVAISPNPFTNTFSLNTSGLLRLYDASGRAVMSRQYTAGEQAGQGLGAGMYYGILENIAFKIVKR